MEFEWKYHQSLIRAVNGRVKRIKLVVKLVLRESISPRIHSILSLGLNFGYRDHNH